MKSTLISLIAAGALTGAVPDTVDRAVAEEPFTLNDAQMDRVTAGRFLDVLSNAEAFAPGGDDVNRTLVLVRGEAGLSFGNTVVWITLPTGTSVHVDTDPALR